MRPLIIFICIQILFVLSLCGQTDSLKNEKTKHLKYGVSVYPKNFNGLEAFMGHLSATDQTMYNEMSETFNFFKQRKQSGKILGYTGAGIGVALMIGTAVSTKDNDRFQSNNSTGYIAGFAVIGAGALIYHLLNIGEKDVIRFKDEFNRKSQEDRKLELVFKSDFGRIEMTGIGFALQYKFH